MELAVGLAATLQRTVTADDTAARLGASFPPAASTPFVLALAEVACHATVEGALGESDITVGVEATISHLAPSPVGAALVASAMLIALDGRRLEFHVEVFDGESVVARIDHTRYVVDRQRLLDRLASARSESAST
jgi:predicted thioesterase